MRTIAEGFVLRVLALAKVSGLGLFGLEHKRHHAVFFMGTITEGLFLRVTAGTPSVILSGFQLDLGGMFGGDMGFGQDGLLVRWDF